MEKGLFLKEVATIIFLCYVTVSVGDREYGACIKDFSLCSWPSFECLDGTCIDRAKYCNGRNDCPDNSDEKFCGRGFYSSDCTNYYSSSGSDPSMETPSFMRCSSYTQKCIPVEWKCDGIADCPSEEDEKNCVTFSNFFTRSTFNSLSRKAIQWLKEKSVPSSTTRKWGPLVHKTAIALYLSDPEFIIENSTVRREITYELSIQLLSRLSHKKLEAISSSELASFIHAFLVTCTDPRDFHEFNLVQELRTRVNKQNYTNPYTLLALCNAEDTIMEADIAKLEEIFLKNNRELWTDTQAIALMALSCASKQQDSSVDHQTIKELALELKTHQHRNGTVENLLSTLLVMQALYAAETDEDPDNFDERKALTYILHNQEEDGSFGNFLLTYYALPVINCKSLVDISDSHCEIPPKDEDTAMFDLASRVGPKVRVRYSIWIGMDRDIERILTMRVPANTSFYGVMEIAAEIDSRFKFEYTVKKRKPYINAVSGILDDPESGQFWFPYTVNDHQPSPVKKSTADVIPKDGDHIVMWYRVESWLS